MPKIIYKDSFGGNLGSALGTGIAGGLNLLAQNKMNRMLEEREYNKKQQQLQQFSKTFQESGYDPKIANILSLLLQQNPKGFHNILAMMGSQDGDQEQDNASSAYQSFPQEQPLQPTPDQESYIRSLSSLFGTPQTVLDESKGAPQIQPPQYTQHQVAQQKSAISPKKEETFASLIASKKPQTPAQLKHQDDIIKGKDNLVDIVQTTNRMLEALPDTSYGIIPSIASYLSPSFLENEYLFKSKTEQFDKDGDHLVNLSTQELKGVPNRLRVQLLQKEKPGVRHSPNVNRQILIRMRDNALNKLKQLESNYPFAKVSPEELSSESSQEPIPTKFMGEAISDGLGSFLLWDKQRNKYVPARRK